VIKTILQALKNIEPSGKFYAEASSTTDALELQVAGMKKALQFPLESRHVRSLIQLAKPAKFGWRDKTLLDKNIRNVWELTSEQLSFASDAWAVQLQKIVDELKCDLGLSLHDELEAELHNLLIYEKGQFFKPHQDSEKKEGMLATLVIILPSNYRGGELVVDHHGEKLDFSLSLHNRLNYIAFYADCYHEVKPVKSGYRVTLTYNLILKKSNKINKSESADKFLLNSVKNYFSAPIVKEYVHEKIEPKRLVYLLDHQYTQAGLSWSILKNADKKRVDALLSVAKILDLDIYLTLADVKETWDCIMEDYHYNRYYREEIEVDDEEVETTSLIDSETHLHHWLDENNKLVERKDLYVPDKYLLFAKATNELKPFDSEYEGWMGNYGNTLERWYHRVAVVLWQKTNDEAMALELAPTATLTKLNTSLKKLEQKDRIARVRTILPFLPNIILQGDQLFIKALYQLVLIVNDENIAFDVLKDLRETQLDSKHAKTWLVLRQKYGEDWCIKLWEHWSKPNTFHRGITVNDIVKIITLLKTNEQNTNKLISWILLSEFRTLQKYDKSAHDSLTRAGYQTNLKGRVKTIGDLLLSSVIAGDKTYFTNCVQHLTNYKTLYPAVELIELLNALMDILSHENKRKFDFPKLKKYVKNDLQASYELYCKHEADWSIFEKSYCTCADCIVLNEYLTAPDAKEKIWPLAQGRRSHIQNILHGLQVPVSDAVINKGSPHKLVLQKNNSLVKMKKAMIRRLKQALSILNV
jgi:hypothetical protein